MTGKHKYRRPLIERFWADVREDTGPIRDSVLDRCLLRDKGKRGHYGAFRMDDNKELRASRVSWFLATGKWPTKHVLHHCDNPPCIHPSHLYEGLDADNARDRMERGRAVAPQGEDHPKAKLTNVQVMAIRSDPRIQIVIAAEYGITQTSVSAIKLRRVWRHLP